MNAVTALQRRVLDTARRAKRALERQPKPTPPLKKVSSEEAARSLFVGHTRFSVHQYGSRYFNATREGDRGAGFTEDQYTEWLYSDERLNPRTEIFTQLSLPQLAIAAENYNVVHYVSFSPSLPERHKQALQKVAETYDFLELNETTKTVSSTPTKALIRSAAKKHGFSSGPVGVYRLDDDDVLSINYFHRMAPYLRDSHIGWWVSQGLGIAAIRLGQDLVYARHYYYPKSAFGPMCIAGYENGDVTHSQAPKHTIMDHTNPTILDSREPAYFHIRHRGQDSTLGGTPKPFYPEAMSRIRNEGPADLEQIRELFPVLSNHLHTVPGRPCDAVDLAESALAINQEPTTFDWKRPGALAIQVELPPGKALKPRELRVSFSIHREPECTATEQEVDDFFAAAKVQQGAEGYFTYVPFQRTGLGHLLVLEPPEGLRITTLRFNAEGERSVDVLHITAYPL